MIEVQKMIFAGREYIVFDKFEYKGVEYLCLYEDISKKVDFRNLGKLKENVEMYVDFVYKCDDGMYEDVVEEDLYNELCSFENKRQENGDNEILLDYQMQIINNKKNNSQ